MNKERTAVGDGCNAEIANAGREKLFSPPFRFLRFYTAWVIRDRVESTASPAMTDIPPKAEVISDHLAAPLRAVPG
jgi:hypothetical protein